MEHIAALLLIVGCSGEMSGGTNECREIAPPVSVFETMEECDTRLPAARNAAQRSARRVLSQCVYIDPAMDEDGLELVWSVKGDSLDAEIVDSGAAVASNDHLKNSRIR